MAKNLGKVTAYGYAKAGGYTGTEEEFTEMIGNLNDDATSASASATAAANSATQASNAAIIITNKIDQAETILDRTMSTEVKRFEMKYNVTTSTSTFTFNPTGYTYATGDRFEVYVNGLKLAEDAYTNSDNVITITGGVSGSGNPDVVEIIGFKNGGLNTDTTLSISGAAADAKVTGDEIESIKEDLSVHRLFTIPNITSFEKGGWNNGAKSSFRQGNRARTIAKFYCLDTVSIALKNQGTPLIYIEKYDSVGTRTEVITWTTQATINKGDIVTITLSMDNTGDATETPLDDIFNTFSFLSVTPVVADVADLTFGQGLISTANAIATFYKNRIYTNEYIPVPDKLIYFSIETGYRAYIVTYDDSFNIIDYGVGGWLTGNIWKDLSGARYYRVMVSRANDTEISPTEATALTIKTFPTVKSETIIAISKDGINDSGKTYAPSYPKSSIIGFEKAIIQGFNAIELHVQMTADGIPVVLHQQNINDVARNSDGTEITQTVSVSGSTLEQLNQYDFGILYGQKYAGTKILTLEQALKFCKDKGVYVFIEPVITLAEENETIVCNLLKKYGLQNQCGYFAYDGPVLVRIKNKIPTAMLYLWRNNDAQMTSGISYVTANLKTNENRVFYYTYAETEVADETIQEMASANIELMLQHLSGEEPVNIETTGNIYSSARVTQIVPATAVLGSI